ncbi:MAG: hypothetical protein HOE92_04190 [Euryarchaeota archaeon]|nr:hypothetical protein [Euryarchaeota archaeon]MBT3971401.1 hypothetical protein [Euryarchaeota archaeon]MBT4407462.1 hypothetical protein [Euryarchaeota archaeon]MBT6644887.1 hypothetical protein [Euryarchaeota archaeon]
MALHIAIFKPPPLHIHERIAECFFSCRNISPSIISIKKLGGLKSALLGGEGLVMDFTGQGTVWVQTRNISSFASRIIPFLPSPNR